MNGKAGYIALGSAATLLLALAFQDAPREYFDLVSITGSGARALDVQGAVQFRDTLSVHGDIGTNGRIHGVGSLPAGTLLFFPALSECPTAWTRYAAVQGRMVVGLQDGGAVDGTSGMALTSSFRVSGPVSTSSIPVIGTWSTSTSRASRTSIDRA